MKTWAWLAMAVAVGVALAGCATSVPVPGLTSGKALTVATAPAVAKVDTATSASTEAALATERLMSPGSKWEVSWKFDGKGAESIISIKRSSAGKIELEYAWASREMGQGSIAVKADILPDGKVEWGRSSGYHFVLTPEENGTFSIWTENDSGVYKGTLRRAS